MKYVFIAIAGVLVYFFVGNDSWKTLLFLLLALLAFIFLVSPSDDDQTSKKQLEKQLGPLGAKASASPVACKGCQVEIHGKAERCYNCGAVVNPLRRFFNTQIPAPGVNSVPGFFIILE